MLNQSAISLDGNNHNTRGRAFPSRLGEGLVQCSDECVCTMIGLPSLSCCRRPVYPCIVNGHIHQSASCLTKHMVPGDILGQTSLNLVPGFTNNKKFTTNCAQPSLLRPEPPRNSINSTLLCFLSRASTDAGNFVSRLVTQNENIIMIYT